MGTIYCCTVKNATSFFALSRGESQSSALLKILENYTTLFLSYYLITVNQSLSTDILVSFLIS